MALSSTIEVFSKSFDDKVSSPDTLARGPGSAEDPVSTGISELIAHRAEDPELAAHRRIWKNKPILQSIYRGFFAQIRSQLADVDGPIVEIGGGPGCFKDDQLAVDPSRTIVSFDVSPCGWLDYAADACAMPLRSGSVGNFVMIDVLHHLAFVQRFFESIMDALRPGGRLVLIEPYVSPVSWLVYRFIHPEPVDGRVRPLDVPRDEPVNDPSSAWDSNTSIPTVLFWRDRAQFEARFPQLRIVERQRMSFVLYPLSGGFGFPSLIPSFALGAVQKVEHLLNPLARLLAFRCLVVIEKR